MQEIWILRLSHRRDRDKRVTTHVALTARALHASGMVYTGDEDPILEEKIKDVNERWGGSFKIYYITNPIEWLHRMRSKGFHIIHLTMYGININSLIDTIRNLNKIVVIVGSEKVPRTYYELSDYNIAIGHQPHSEVAAVAIFLDRYFNGMELDIEFKGGKYRVIPSERGKIVEKVNG